LTAIRAGRLATFAEQAGDPVGGLLYSRFKIEHSTIDWATLSRRLAEHYGDDDRNVLKSSQIFNEDVWASAKKLYATESPDCRLICAPGGAGELQVYVEPVEGNILSASMSAWKGVRNILKKDEPKITHLVMVDGNTGKEILTGTTGARVEFTRKETILPILIGVATLVYILVGVRTFAAQDPGRFFGGAIVGTVGAAVAVYLAVVEIRKGTLRWK
jgi:hypothetical protein